MFHAKKTGQRPKAERNLAYLQNRENVNVVREQLTRIVDVVIKVARGQTT